MLARILSRVASILICFPLCALAAEDKSLVLHYTFDKDTGDSVKDRSSYGNDGKLSEQARYLDELDGRRGIIRLAGDSAYIDCGDADSLRVGGDLTLEMWVRMNGPVKNYSAVVFGDHPLSTFFFNISYWASLHVWYGAGHESVVVPVRRDIISSDKWSHIAVVVEYPRCRFYRDGQLVRDAYMPMEGILKPSKVHKYIGGEKGSSCPIDVDEFRFYSRALAPAEIAAHAEGKEIAPQPDAEVGVDTNWYEKTATVRISCKNGDYKGGQITLALQKPDYATVIAAQKATLAESSPGSGRYVASATFPLAGLENQSLDAVAELSDPTSKQTRRAYGHVTFVKPEWVDTQEGYSDDVLPGWTPVQTEQKADGTLEVRVWGRRHLFGATPFAQQIESRGSELLASPISLSASADGKALEWKNGKTTLKDSSKTAASFEQAFDNDQATLRIEGKIEYDGYTIYDCRVQAKKDLSLENLMLEIPMHTRHATLGYGDKVFAENAKIPIAQWFGDAIKGDLGFRFSPDVWLGDEERGLLWQTESDQDWHWADLQKAIEILPRGDVTTFRANFVNVPTKLAAGESLHYRFALLGTPSRPLLRDAWDLRLARSEPYGADLDMPNRTLAGRPALDYLAETGVRQLFTITNDLWGYPVPVNERFSGGLHRLIEEAHARGIRLHNYLMYTVAFPAVAPEFEVYGLDMCSRPLHPFIESISPPGDPRPGPVSLTWGADREGVMLTCPNSKAMQDAFIYRLAERYKVWGDDGIYLDGGGELTPCQNLAHGCGYKDKDGKVHPTYPAFAMRKFRQRIYAVTKKYRPEGVVDYHCSFAPNQAVFAYTDVIWTGEHWWHLRETGTKHILSELTLTKFRTEFTGYQHGVAAETLAYRLGSPMRVAAISLLHDIPVRPSTPMVVPEDPAKRDRDYFQIVSKLWKVRDQFGAKEAQKLFYYNNQDYVRVSGQDCYATLLKHPTNGTLVFISNLSTDAQKPVLEFNLSKLNREGGKLEAFNVLNEQPVGLSGDGKLSVSLGSEEWTYLWLRPRSAAK